MAKRKIEAAVAAAGVENTQGILAQVEPINGAEQVPDAVIAVPGSSDPGDAPALRENNEALECVKSAASTITRCSDGEIKNFVATADFACRQFAVQLADMWKEVCQTAEKNGAGEKAKVVSLSAKITIDHTNILMHDTKIKTSFSENHSRSGEVQEDLRQVEFAL